MSDAARTLQLLDQALALAPEERAGFLDRACADDAALRDEVATLLLADEAAEGFLEPVTLVAGDRANERIGPYRLLREIGSGGMGRVYLAERADALYQRQVAVKFLRWNFADLRSRFDNERRILAALDHPHIAKLLDAGSDAQGSPYVVMEFVEGEPITRWCERRGLATTERIALFRKVLDAVQTAHGRLIVHRDLKPGNILVGVDGAPKLLDFGIAKLLGETTERELTRTGPAPMTPEYASPEQVRGEPVSTASDVYALGVLLYELLTGARPYEVATLSPAELERVVCADAVTRPSAAAQQRGARLPPDLDHVVLKAMAKSPADRYPSCAQFADDLGRFLDGQPVLAVHASVRYRAGKFVRRHRVGVALGAAVALALVAAAAIALGQAARARGEARVAGIERDRAARVTGFLTTMLAAADPSVGGRKVTVAELLDAAAKDVDGELGSDPATAATVRVTLAQTYRSLGLLDEALAQSRQAMAAAATSTDPRAIAAAELILGQVLLERGDYAGSQPMLLHALGAYVGDPERAQDLAAAELLLGQWASQQQKFSDAETHFAAALATLTPRVAPDDRRLGELYDSMAVTKGRAGDLVAAEALHGKALAIFRKARGEYHPETARVLFNLGNVREMRDDFTGAEAAYREAVTIQREALGAHHPDLVQTLASETFMLNRAQRFTEAVASGRAAVAAATPLPSPHPIRAYAAAMYGEALLNAGDAAAAITPLTDAADERAAMMGPEHPLTLNSRSLVGAALAASGRRDEGVAMMRSALDALTKTLGAEHEFSKRAAARLAKYRGS